MAFRIILVLSIYLLSSGMSQDTNFKFHRKIFKRNYSNIWSKETSKLYDATQIGYKRGLSKELSNSFKSLGIVHLLTPSGIHLASILLILKKILNKHLLTFLVAIFLILLKSIGGFYSIKRICTFYLLNRFLKSTKISFILTFFIDLLVGGYTDSPLSFALSFMFWGTILFSNKSKILLVINLFICQLISAYFFTSQINLFSFILNPLITSVFSTFFSFLSFQYWINYFDILDSFSYFFISSFGNTINWLSSSLSFGNTFIGPLIFLVVLLPRKKHISLIIFYSVFNSSILNQSLTRPYMSSYYLKKSSGCKEYFGNYGFASKCYLRDIKKAQN